MNRGARHAESQSLTSGRFDWIQSRQSPSQPLQPAPLKRGAAPYSPNPFAKMSWIPPADRAKFGKIGKAWPFSSLHSLSASQESNTAPSQPPQSHCFQQLMRNDPPDGPSRGWRGSGARYGGANQISCQRSAGLKEKASPALQCSLTRPPHHVE